MKAAYLILAGVALLADPLRSAAQVTIGATPGPMSCAYCDLRTEDLSGKDLTDANLVGSNLRGVKLVGAKLDGAILTAADLSGADLSGASLGASSKGPADLTSANLAGAKLPRAVLTGAHLLFAGLGGTDFSGASLAGAVLGPEPRVGTSDGRRTSFQGARMDRGAAVGGGTADVSGIIWNEPKADAITSGPAGVTCGQSNLSSVKKPVFVSTKGTDSATCGADAANACKTLAHGLGRCTPDSCDLLVMFGEYDLPATLAFESHTTPPIGARLYGGCVASGHAGAGLSSLTVAPPGGVPAVSVAGVKPVVLENFKILGSAAADGGGAPAVTVRVAENSAITLNNSMIVGGKGGKGADGAEQPTGMKGGNAAGQGAGTNLSCSNSNGGNGSLGQVLDGYSDAPYCGLGMQYYWGQNGSPGDTSGPAPGGAPGDAYSAFCPPITPYDGKGGTGGGSAGCGTGGSQSPDTKGSFSGASWSPGAGGIGTRGGHGGGGGGGGSGGAYCTYCFAYPRWYSSGGGGGGGAGGCGGPAGPGGQQGGASFAIVAAAGSVLTPNKSRVVAGRSGDGGKGGRGGNGGGGGPHDSGQGTSGYGYHGGRGGDGGDGGGGGGGGGGAGGNGGPSVAVALVGGAKVEGSGIYYKGNSGDGGGGGSGGASQASSGMQLCGGPSGGASGMSALADETTTYP